MGHLDTAHALTWTVDLVEHGYTCHEIRDPSGRRWGWIINASRQGWDAHVGDFGQAATLPLPLPRPPVGEDRIRLFGTITEAKAWVEQEIADAWRDAER